MAQEDEALLAAEAQLPGGEDEIHWSELESDSSEDVEYFPAAAPASHDHEAGGSREPAPESPAAATVTESQVIAVRAHLSSTAARDLAERGPACTGGGQESP